MLSHIHFIGSAKDKQQSTLLKLLLKTIILFCLKRKLNGTTNKKYTSYECKIGNMQYC